MRRHRLTATTAAVALLGVALLSACGDDGPECDVLRGDLPMATASPRDDALVEQPGPGWIGGDSAYSVPLPDDRTVWLFSDSFIGSVNRWGVPRKGNALVHNALLVEAADGSVETRTSELFDKPHAFFKDPAASDYYWVQDGLVEGDSMLVFLAKQHTKPGTEGFEWVGSALARVSLPELRVTGIDELPTHNHVAWGAAVMETPQTTYVYGVEDRAGDGKYLHLARATAGAVGQHRWSYYADGEWVADQAASTRLVKGIANELSVTPYKDGFLMISHDTRGIFSANIEAYRACSPEGPWKDPQTIYKTPETGQGRHFTYNAHAHPERTTDDGLLISYNVNTFDKAEFFREPTLYRPRFIRLPL